MAKYHINSEWKEIQTFVQKHEHALTLVKNPYICYFFLKPVFPSNLGKSSAREAAESYASFFGYQVEQVVSGQNFPLIGTDEVGNGSYSVAWL